ncbi:DNA replication regulator SLD3-domain-containing protein [Durotheca rogersii]|uniref:DNA replication regulator SLD3-domain-containing protein n=1 Tax=Durotheca rogersii TaxID=419775 RepID=UPI002220C974|nr:DNA replication regulator SLD3-domain-containing protein [Durotheca rogersii]KAI5865118.1 DNA replication regulator SLD3-domain-containing protein [Durotheca rogersii]
MPLGAPGPDASRQPPGGILMSSPEAFLKPQSRGGAATAPPGRKRKRDSEAMEEFLKPSIVVKPYPPKLTLKPRSLQPLMLLPREYLQLSFLDLSSPHGSFEPSRCFESNIKILDLEGRMASVVLIARLETDKTLYVLERQKDCLYTLCQLGSWVDLQELERLATVSCPGLIECRPKTSRDMSTSHPLTTPQLHHDTKKRKLAIEAIQALVKRPARSRSVSTPTQNFPPAESSALHQADAESHPESNDAIQRPSLSTVPGTQAAAPSELDDALTPPTASGIFDNIRTQYLESLYHSMGSLGYFAKGPLSRARATFHLDCDSNLEMNDLVDFLKSLVMTTAQIDKKYRETIPAIISKMKPIFQDSDVEQGTIKSRKRKAKKMRIGKDGLYPMEADHIRKWWTTQKPQTKGDETMTTDELHEIKLQIACLRSRETQLQMIMILEILALEPLTRPENSKDSELPGLSAPEGGLTEVNKDVLAKKRSRHNFPSLLDIHADRLCIWQSTALEGVKLSADPHASSGSEAQKPLGAVSDPLRDFCVDIIVPFFSARLPEQCDSLNRKLGGPVMMPPPLPTHLKSKKSETPIKPKQKPSVPKSKLVTKRPASSRPSVALERVLSRETERQRRSISRGPGGVIALMRSVSTPMLKREISEPLSMTGIPKADSTVSQEKAAPPFMSTSIRRKSEAEKAKKEALVNAELQDAITVLRRPNREVVGKAMAEAAERRATISLSQLKKSRKPTQHPHSQSVVKATPIGKRSIDVLGNNQRARPQDAKSVEADQIPSSSLIPASVPRRRNHEVSFAFDKSPAPPSSQARADLVQATPSRPSNLKQSFLSVPRVDETPILASSPIPMSRKPSLKGFRDSGIEMPTSPIDEITETPIKPRPPPVSSERLIAVTPIRRVSNQSRAFAESPTAMAKDRGDQRGKLSIFERLGWDDDLDELG